MEIFDSPWLISMLAKSSKTPHGRLLSLFDILDDWLSAPHIQMALELETGSHSRLIAYCIEQAKALGAENPPVLAEHIVLIARSATQQTLELLAAGKPSKNSLAHAKQAANALILAQTQQPKYVSGLMKSKPAVYSIAASLFIMIGIAVMWLPELMHIRAQQMQAQSSPITIGTATHQKDLSAYDATQMYAKYEQMRQGTCHFPEVLLIPDKHKAIYLENVVGGKLPANLADLAIANSYLEKVRCNFTPMLMASSK